MSEISTLREEIICERNYLRKKLFAKEIICERNYLRKKLFAKEIFCERNFLRKKFFAKEIICERNFLRKKFFAKEFFAKEICAEFIFAILAHIRKNNFRKNYDKLCNPQKLIPQKFLKKA